MALSSPVLALLEEPSYELKEFALKSLNEKVDEIWPEIADHIPQIEELYEDPSFPAQALAALVVSKVYYNLGDMSSSVHYALAAGPQLDLATTGSEYIDTVISHCIRTYITARQAQVDKNQEELPDESSLKVVVERMLERCVATGQFTLALGVALEARRIDIIESILREYREVTPDSFAFLVDASVKLVSNRNFRTKVLRSLAGLLSDNPKIYYVLLTKIIIQLDDPQLAISLLNNLDHGLASQVAFDLVATASQELLGKTAKEFRSSPKESHARIVKILSGVPTCDFEVTFLERHNHTDLGVLQRTKSALDGRNSMFHSALSFQNAFLHAGTTADEFFRSNIDWLGKATHWTKFTATAALGVIHKGNLTQGRRILQPYLPESGQGSAHSRGGALYGLGLVFAGFGKEVLEFLQESLSAPQSTSGNSGADADADEGEVVAHGACLGIALAAMRTQNEDLYAKLREVLYTDSAIAGEAAGLAMGLVMLGSKSATAEQEMLQYARDTQHEKIIRSLSLGLALLNYGKEEGSNALVDELLADQDPILRYGGCFTLALAFAGTGDNSAIARLLHTAVADASDDVRRAAVISLGFILLRNPSSLPRMVELLSESHNPHVRYGTTMALGVACAGTGLIAAVDMLEPMMKDPVDFVRQGAMIALSMILVQQTGEQNPRIKTIREHFATVVKTKNEDALAKFGATLAQGIVDAGGCNATISLEHRQTGNLNMKAVAGLSVFLQYWYWFPFAHFMTLAFTPTTVVCVKEENLKIPVMELFCSAPASKFGYPPKLEEPNSKPQEKLVTAILSTTMTKARRKRNKAAQTDLAIGSIIGEEATEEAKDESKDAKTENDNSSEVASVKTKERPKESKEPKEETKEKAEEEPKHFNLQNMSRVVPWQRKYVSLPDSSRFALVAAREELSGVMVVRDTKPDEEFKSIRTQRQAHSREDETEEAPLPPPFRIAPASD